MYQVNDLLIYKKDVCIVEEIIQSIPTIETIKSDSKILEQEYKLLIQSGTHEDLIKIIKTTYLRNKERLDNNKKH